MLEWQRPRRRPKPGVMTEIPAWSEIAAHAARELGESLHSPSPLARPGPSRATWAVESSLGEPVVKVRHGDRADEKTRWCAANLPRLGARGYPVPEIVWHGLVGNDWHVVVQRRLPGQPLRSPHPHMLHAVLTLVELQADADIAPGERDFAAYQGLVLFDDWSGATPRAGRRTRGSSAAGCAAGSNRCGAIAWRRVTSPTTI